MTICKRADRAAIRIAGPDATRLLHDVITANIENIDGNARWWALLSPQGKVQAEGLISFHEGAYWLDTAKEVVGSFVKRMTLYKLRANVTIEDLSDSHMVGWAKRHEPDGVTDADPRSTQLGFRVIAPVEDTGDWSDDDCGFAETRLRLGIAEIGNEFSADTLFPHDIGMDLLGGIDFKKGCYVGQEVVSRMQHRGTARRRPVIVQAEALVAGGEIICQGKSAGVVGGARGGIGLGFLRLDRLTDTGAAMAGDIPARLALPDWASYHFGDSQGGAEEDAS